MRCGLISTGLANRERSGAFQNVTGSHIRVPLFSASYATLYSALVAIRNSIVCDVPLCVAVIAGTRRTQGNKAQLPRAAMKAACDADLGCVLHASILVQARASARTRCCGLLTGPPVSNWWGSEYAAKSKRRYVGTGEIKPSGLSTAAEFTRKMAKNSEPPLAPSSCTFITMPQAAGPPTGRSPFFDESRRFNALQYKLN